jgi:NAD(P)-dependent dehydrogenase (short-subunit alcohol dehydrogenase family)
METKKSMVITGGTSGLGNELMNAFLNEGWMVAVCGRRMERIEKIRRENDNVLAEICDIRIEPAIALFLEKVKMQFGGIDVLILNAASIGPLPLPKIEDLRIEDLRLIFETNFFGNFNFLKYSLPLLRKGGMVIHITSDAATTPYPGWGAYSSSKAAFDTIIRILNAELEEKRIKALSYDPGDMDTEMHHIALPEDRSPLKSPKDAASVLLREIMGRLGANE